MTRRKYSYEFKEQIIRECQETGNVALVARRHEISPITIHTWLSKYRKQGRLKSLPRGEAARTKALEQRLKEVSQENDLYYYSNRRRHGSLGYMAPAEFYRLRQSEISSGQKQAA